MYTSVVVKRFKEHVRYANNPAIKLTHFHRALLKYGADTFNTTELESVFDQDYANVREKYYITYYATLRAGYNMTAGGDGASGYIQSPAHKAKIRAKNLGSTRTVAQKLNISKAHIGQTAWNKGVSVDTSHLKEQETCRYCGTVATIAVIARHHKENCVLSPNYTKKQSTKNKMVVRICPHCHYKGTGGAMTRYHFNNCKHKE